MKKEKSVLKILGIVLGCLYFFLLLVHDAFDVNEFEIMSEIIPNATERVLITILRAFTAGSILIAILSCFFEINYLSRAVRYFSPLITFLNLVFCKVNFACYLGNEFPTNLLIVRIVGFAIENLLILAISIFKWIEFLKDKSKGRGSIKNIIITFVFIFFVTIFCSPTTTLLSLNGGFLGFKTREFSPFHIVELMLAVIIPVLVTMVFKKRSFTERRFICSFLCLSLFFGYFSRYDFETYKDLFISIKEHDTSIRMDVLPLQLCNFGIILSFITYTFNNKKVYYFNLFGNFFGFLLGMILPNIGGDVFKPTTVHYWQNHIYGLTLCVLGLTLSLFPRPTKKDFKNSLFMFFGYFIIVAIIDVVFSYDLEKNSGCDIFFLNGSTYSDILHIGFMREDPFVIRMKDSFGIEHRIYYLYWIVVIFIYSILMFVVYYVISLIYKIGDMNKKKTVL